MKIGILSKKLFTPFEEAVLNSILDSGKFQIAFAVIDNRKPKSLKQKLFSNLKKGRGGYVLVMAFRKIFYTGKRNTLTAVSFFSGKGVPVFETADLYAADTISYINNQGPDLLVLLDGFGIIKKPVLNIAPKGILSYHHGDMRKYRGMPPAFWELYNGEKEMGLTVQKLNEGLDSGSPVVERKITICKKDSLNSLTAHAYKESETMMLEALEKIHSGSFMQDTKIMLGKIYTLPNLSQWIRFHFTVIVRKLF